MRRQLLLLVGATTLLVLAAFLVPLALLVRSQAEDRELSAATVEAQTVATLIGTPRGDTPWQDGGSQDGGLPPGGRSERDSASVTVDNLNARGDRTVTVFLSDGSMLGAPAERGDAVELAARGRAFVTDGPDGSRELYIPVQGLPQGTAVVRSVVPASALHRGVASAWLAMGALGAALFATGLALAAWLARHLVNSVGQVAAVADRLAGGDLTARVEPDGPPEVRRVGHGLNHLAGRVGELVAAQREEVADISHRLRTPVTALRLDAESLRDPEEAARLGADVDALERMVDEVIREARRPVRDGSPGDLAAAARERAAFWSALAEEQDRRFDVAVPDHPLRVDVSGDDLLAVLDALLGNVFAHTPDGTALRVEARTRPGGGGVLVVDDSGPGFPAGYRDGSLLTRGRSGGGSTGLGLDIARRTAEASGGRLVLDRAPGGGARVVAEFGPGG